MNALGLPGASIDGILGFTILARFRLEIDPSRDLMTWTQLDYVPADPPIPGHAEGEAAPAELQVMNALGPLAKGLAFLIGKQPEEERLPRGFLGLEWAETRDALSGQMAVRIERVLAGSPAARADIQPGDYLIRAGSQAVKGLKNVRAALATIQPGKAFELMLRRRDPGSTNRARELAVTVTAGEGF
jgi:hypothetical protein